MATRSTQNSGGGTVKEKRAHPRHACHEPTFYSTKDGVFEGVIRDRDQEGVKGIFISTREKLAIGQVVTVAILSPGEGKGKKRKGMIARKEKDGYAVQFTNRLNK